MKYGKLKNEIIIKSISNQGQKSDPFIHSFELGNFVP